MWLCGISYYRGLGPWGPNLVRKYTSARFGEGEKLTEEESRLLTGNQTAKVDHIEIKFS